MINRREVHITETTTLYSRGGVVWPSSSKTIGYVQEMHILLLEAAAREHGNPV